MKIKFAFSFSLTLLVFIHDTRSQQFSGWAASFNTSKLTPKLSLHFDAQLRSTDQLAQLQTILLRPGLNFHANKNLVLTAGYGFISNRRVVSGMAELLPEHRTWQQALLTHKLKSTVIAHRLRFEERFISNAKVINGEVQTSGHDEAFRLRYFIRSIVPFKKQSAFSRGLFLGVQNEIFLNTGDKTAVNGKTFDQNRFYVAIGYRASGKIDIEAGYMNQYTVTSASFINNHIAQIAVYKRL